MIENWKLTGKKNVYFRERGITRVCFFGVSRKFRCHCGLSIWPEGLFLFSGLRLTGIDLKISTKIFLLALARLDRRHRKSFSELQPNMQMLLHDEIGRNYFDTRSAMWNAKYWNSNGKRFGNIHFSKKATKKLFCHVLGDDWWLLVHTLSMHSSKVKESIVWISLLYTSTWIPQNGFETVKARRNPPKNLQRLVYAAQLKIWVA